MALLIPFYNNILFSSDPLVGADNLSPDKSSFTITLNSPLKVPHNAMNCYLGVITANVWNDAANISPFYNNNVFGATNGAVVIPVPNLQEGLYSLDNVNTALSLALVNLGYDKDLYTLTADVATGLVIITVKTIGYGFDFTILNSIGSVLGFNYAFTSTVANQSYYGSSVAMFNRVNSYLLRSDLVSNGIPINANGQGIIASIPITAPVGGEISYDPQNVIWTDASELISMSKSNIRFELLDQSLRRVSTNEIFTFTICIKYAVLRT